MSEIEELKVGRRGEIYTTRKIRARTGLTPGGKAIAFVEGNRLIVQPKPTALDLLKKPRVNPKPLRPELLSELRRELTEEIEAR
jgi:bifunctional DNA-binding transcriptional regulator/antitoxin component of YhaV-PrlF toxin-antitoxin module